MTKFLDIANFINKAMGIAFIFIGIIGYFQVTPEFGTQMVLLGFFQLATVLIYRWSKKYTQNKEEVK